MASRWTTRPTPLRSTRVTRFKTPDALEQERIKYEKEQARRKARTARRRKKEKWRQVCFYCDTYLDDERRLDGLDLADGQKVPPVAASHCRQCKRAFHDECHAAMAREFAGECRVEAREGVQLREDGSSVVTDAKERDEEDESENWRCFHCTVQQHVCMSKHCKQLGRVGAFKRLSSEDDEDDEAEDEAGADIVMQCSRVQCGNYFHLDCIEKEPCADVKPDHSSFVCPHHACSACSTQRTDALRLCLRCPAAHHKRCYHEQSFDLRRPDGAWMICPEHEGEVIPNPPWNKESGSDDDGEQQEQVEKQKEKEQGTLEPIVFTHPLFRLPVDEPPATAEQGAEPPASLPPIHFNPDVNLMQRLSARAAAPSNPDSETEDEEDEPPSAAAATRRRRPFMVLPQPLWKQALRAYETSPPFFQRISNNRYPPGSLIKKPTRPRKEDTSVCECTPADGCGEECHNRIMLIECDKRTCPAGASCTNQRIQNRQYAKLAIKRIGDGSKGWGAVLKQDVSEGDLIIEYIGEVIDLDTCKERLRSFNARGVANYYLFQVDAQTVIDASRVGNVARFLNHSCNPNCRTEKWHVGSATRVGIFAAQDMPSGTELTYNYNFDSDLVDVGGEKPKQPCLCGARNCSGFLGVAPRSMADLEAEERRIAREQAKKKKRKRRRKPKVVKEQAGAGEGEPPGKRPKGEVVEGKPVEVVEQAVAQEGSSAAQPVEVVQKPNGDADGDAVMAEVGGQEVGQQEAAQQMVAQSSSVQQPNGASQPDADGDAVMSEVHPVDVSQQDVAQQPNVAPQPDADGDAVMSEVRPVSAQQQPISVAQPSTATHSNGEGTATPEGPVDVVQQVVMKQAVPNGAQQQPDPQPQLNGKHQHPQPPSHAALAAAAAAAAVQP